MMLYQPSQVSCSEYILLNRASLLTCAHVAMYSASHCVNSMSARFCYYYRHGEAVDRTLLKSLLRMLADLQVTRHFMKLLYTVFTRV